MCPHYVRDQDSHPFKTTGTITILFTLDLHFGQETARQKTLHRMAESVPCVTIKSDALSNDL